MRDEFNLSDHVERSGGVEIVRWGCGDCETEPGRRVEIIRENGLRGQRSPQVLQVTSRLGLAACIRKAHLLTNRPFVALPGELTLKLPRELPAVNPRRDFPS